MIRTAPFPDRMAPLRKVSKASRACKASRPCRSRWAWMENSPRCNRSANSTGILRPVPSIYSGVWEMIKPWPVFTRFSICFRTSFSGSLCGGPVWRPLGVLLRIWWSGLAIGLTPSIALRKESSSFTGGARTSADTVIRFLRRTSGFLTGIGRRITLSLRRSPRA